MKSTLIFFVNGKKIYDEDCDPSDTLLYYLRKKLKLCGTKLGCSEGGCGACTVMISQFDRSQNKILHRAINACLAPICSIHGQAVTTVEGIGSTKTRLHPVQERIAKSHGTQCGFCTPGIVMSMYTLIRTMNKPSMLDLERAFQGNLCRCTGYRPIIEGYKTFTEDWELMQTNTESTAQQACAMGKNCCKFADNSEDKLFDISKFTPYCSSQEPIFPPELKLNSNLDEEFLTFKNDNTTWFRPTAFEDLLKLKNKYHEAKIVVGNTEIGIEVKFKNCIYPILISANNIPEIKVMNVLERGVEIGASVTLEQLEYFLVELIKTLPPSKTRIFASIVTMLKFFAGKQIRSVASVGGNIMTASPISDLNTIFLAARIDLNVQSELSSRVIQMDDKFFISYRKHSLKPNEVLRSIIIPFSKSNQYFVSYKQSRRLDDDIAIVNTAINVQIDHASLQIESIDAAFGGLAPTTIVTHAVKKYLTGQTWSIENLDKVYSYLLKDLTMDTDAPGGMVQYRKSLALSLLFKAFVEISTKIQCEKNSASVLPGVDVSALNDWPDQFPRSAQYFEVPPNTNERKNFTGLPIVHQSAFKHATGEAIYCDDMPKFENELYMGLVCSTRSHASIESIDASEALKIKGVIGFLGAKDIKNNGFGAVVSDEEIFASMKVTCHGQLIGVVVAESQQIAKAAAKKVNVDYADLTPVIISIEDAIKHESYYAGSPKKLTNGDVESIFAKHQVVEGECRTGGQDHFYLETQSVIVVPKKEDGEIEIYCSTQFPAGLNSKVAELLEMPENKVTTKVKRIGGGFGGKESRYQLIAYPAVMAAAHFDRPVRIMLDRDEDMRMTGGRHPFLMKYKAAFDRSGKILAMTVDLYCNAGNTLDLSYAVLEQAITHLDNAYCIRNVVFRAFACKTNLPSNTVCRGSGGPQAMFLMETVVRHVAQELQKNSIDISETNLYHEGDLTFYNQKMENCNIRRCWKQCLESSHYLERLAEIDAFNKTSRWKKRGISAVPTSYGIAFGLPFLMQAGALVLIYRDGSMLLSHGGTEMGQGLNTKMIQVASTVLEIANDRIHISETSTDKVPNASPTAASTGSDLNGMAVHNACQEIKRRLEPFRLENPTGTWEDWVSKAYFERVSLSATGFYKTPNLGYDWNTNTGNLFNYFVYGAAVSEVEIECLTGNHRVLRTDIVMDLGQSLNPAIDIGQIEGAFMQGYGLYVMEEMVYSPDGYMYTTGPGTYKVPGFNDIPKEFNVSLLKESPNPRAIYSSKAVGEPPLFLSSSVNFAIREAVRAARTEVGLRGFFRFDAPATTCNIRMACEDKFTKIVSLAAGKEKKRAWNLIP